MISEIKDFLLQSYSWLDKGFTAFSYQNDKPVVYNYEDEEQAIPLEDDIGNYFYFKPKGSKSVSKSSVSDCGFYYDVVLIYDLVAIVNCADEVELANALIIGLNNFKTTVTGVNLDTFDIINKDFSKYANDIISRLDDQVLVKIQFTIVKTLGGKNTSCVGEVCKCC